jgi:hypothetical protein
LRTSPQQLCSLTLPSNLCWSEIPLQCDDRLKFGLCVVGALSNSFLVWWIPFLVFSQIDKPKAPGQSLDETNATVPSDSANEAQIESNCSPELKSSRTSASNSGSCGSKLGKGFQNFERARREGSSHIYIARVWRYLIFSNNPVFKIKIIPKKVEIVFNVRKISRRLQKI